MKNILGLLLAVLLFTSCSENYSNGERIGVLNKFTQKGMLFKSYEGHLNVTQTGMTSSDGFDFSIDNDNEPVGLVQKLDSVTNLGWKVKLTYHEVNGFNWFHNRGETNHFVTDVVVIDKNFSNNRGFSNNVSTSQTGKVIDTIYVIIVDKSKLK